MRGLNKKTINSDLRKAYKEKRELRKENKKLIEKFVSEEHYTYDCKDLLLERIKFNVTRICEINERILDLKRVRKALR